MNETTIEQWDSAIDLLYSFVKEFVDKEAFEQQLREVTGMAYSLGVRITQEKELMMSILEKENK